MSVLGNLEPKNVFGYFEDITQIPHGSHDTKRISDWLVEFAEKRNLEHYQDQWNNVIIIKPASEGYENSDPVIIQGHMDMVCEKTPDSDFDFKKDGLKLLIDGDFVTADGTTLGGDDGIAVAMALALLDSDEYKHPRLEVVITSDEEVGLIGAEHIDVSKLTAKKFLNIDSEEEGIFTTSCAGGVSATNTIPVKRAEASGHAVEITVGGLKGGHSGIMINKERGNGNTIMGRVLRALEEKGVDFVIESLAGGLKDNAICSLSKATVITSDAAKAGAVVEEMDKIISHEYATPDPGVKVTCTDAGEKKVSALTKEDTHKVVQYLITVPQGVQNMSMDIPGLVETSLNMGILKLEEDKVTATYAVRSSVETRKDYIVDKLRVIGEMLGGTIELQGDYPGWEYKADSELRKVAMEVFQKQYGHEPKVEAIHAGLECGLFAGKIPDLDALSVGPDILYAHTPDEKLSISSTNRVWDFVVDLLAALK